MEQNLILVVEDDEDISNMICDLLNQHGFAPAPAYSGTEALLLLKHEHYDLVLLDLMLPGKSGREVLATLREDLGLVTPVIAVSAIGAVDNKVDLLTAGADDYLTKPFDNAELLARIQVQLRKAATTQTADPQADSNTIAWGDLVLHQDALTAQVNNQPLTLTKREVLILKLLMENPKKVFTKSNIYESVWGEEFYGDDNTVNVHISNLRQKLAKLSPEKEYIQTVWGIGFKLKDL